MKIEQLHVDLNGWRGTPGSHPIPANLVFMFGAPDVFRDAGRVGMVAERYPNAVLVGCTTAGEIHGGGVFDETLSATAIQFERSRVQFAYATHKMLPSTREIGRFLGKALDPAGLSHIMVLSDGLLVNGSELVRGLRDTVPAGVPVTGGLAGDGPRFARTAVYSNGAARVGCIAAIGFYGEHIRIGHGSRGGWTATGAEYRVTRSRGNVLFELDGRNALALYKAQLGADARDLPGSGLRYPLAMTTQDGGGKVVRTLLAVDEAAQSLTFAGDMPVGARVRFMRAELEALVEGAAGAAQQSASGLGGRPAEAAVLVSCVGRKLVLGDRAADEVARVRGILGEQAAITGFYSYGEISPLAGRSECELHNQTMTVTTFAEVTA